MKNPFTDHPRDTVSPQTYIEHGKFAFVNSLILVFAGLVGMTHAIFPFLFPFRTSTIIIQSFKKLVDSRRHIEELKKEMPEDYLIDKHLE